MQLVYNCTQFKDDILYCYYVPGRRWALAGFGHKLQRTAQHLPHDLK